MEGRVDEVRHQLREDASEGLAIAIIYIALACLLLLGLLMISISSAYLIGMWIGPTWGFLVVGVLYMIVAGIYWNHFRKEENQAWVKERMAAFMKGSKQNSVEILEEDTVESA